MRLGFVIFLVASCAFNTDEDGTECADVEHSMCSCVNGGVCDFSCGDHEVCSMSCDEGLCDVDCADAGTCTVACNGYSYCDVNASDQPASITCDAQCVVENCPVDRCTVDCKGNPMVRDDDSVSCS